MSSTNNILSNIPQLRSRWWTAMLALSLMVNLLIAGALLARGIGPRLGMGGPQDNIAQLIPRKFIADMPTERRQEIILFLRDFRKDMKALSEQSQATTAKLADRLENYDAADAKSLVDSIVVQIGNLAAKRGEVLSALIAKLTPEERANLAKAIRERETFRKKLIQF
jgi:Heavy-metal resistance